MNGANPPGRISGWIQTHKPAAGAAAAAVAVLGFAVYRRHASSAAGDAGAAADGSSDPLNTAGIASPDTSADDEANATQDQLDSLQAELDQALANPTAPAAPKPAAKGLSSTFGTYVRQQGDTLAKIAMRVYGTDAPWAINELKAANPDLATFGPKALLNLFGGHVVKVPKAAPGRYKPDAQKPGPQPKRDQNGGTPVKRTGRKIPLPKTKKKVSAK